MPDELDSISVELPQNDSNANRENEYLFKAKQREEALKVVIHYITKVAIIVVFVVIVIVFLIRVAHFIIPDCWKWLNDVQLQGLDKFFFSGALGSLMAKHAGKLFNSN
jgi:hypothetical protein